MKFFNLLIVLFLCLEVAAQAQNVFPTGAGLYAGIGTGATNPVTTPATALHILKNTTSLNQGSFITIDNRGPNAKYPTSHIIGGILFSGYRDILAPANVAGIWAVRSPAAAGLSSTGDLVFGTTDVPVNITSDNVLPAERMRITYDGKVGIGTSPGAMLHIKGNNTDAHMILETNNGNAKWEFVSIQSNANFAIADALNGTSPFVINKGAPNNSFGITNNGNVLINLNPQINTSYKLDVGGAVRANKVVVNTTGADFVFDSSYDLKSLSHVESYINQNHHLQDIEPAAAMQKDGIDLGDNQTKLLQKIEELTLYLIEQNKKIESLEKKVDQLQHKKSAN